MESDDLNKTESSNDDAWEGVSIGSLSLSDLDSLEVDLDPDPESGGSDEDEEEQGQDCYSENFEDTDTCSSSAPSTESKSVMRRRRGGFKRGYLKRRKASRSSSSESRGTHATDETESSTAASISKPKKRRYKIGIKKKYFWQKQDNVDSMAKESAVVTFHNVSVSANEEEVLRENLAAAQADASLTAIADYLKLTLDSSWSVSCSDDTLSIFKIINHLNPFVEKAITWQHKQVNILVHNYSLPSNHNLWQVKRPDVQNSGDVTDYLTRLSSKLNNYKVCPAIQTHNNLWELFSTKGHAEVNCKPHRFRSVACKILIENIYMCKNCQRVSKTFADFTRREIKKRDKSDDEKADALNKTNNRYRSKESLMKKVQKINQEKRLSKQAIRRLRVKVDQLLKKSAEKIDKGLGTDFIKIMSENADKMSQLESIFWEQQSKALSKRDKARSMRWHPAMIRLALHLRMLSPGAYDFLRGIISLPSQRLLHDYSQFIDIGEGVQQEILEHLHTLLETECKNENEKYFSLLLDEMSIRSDLVYSSRTGKLVGYTNLSEVEQVMCELEAEIQGKSYEQKLAKKVLVYMLNGAVKRIRFVPAIYSTDDLSACQLYFRTWDVIYAVEEAGVKILAIIFDGASVNRKFMTLHHYPANEEGNYRIRHPFAEEERYIYFMLDPPHLLKTFRNCFANSGSHRRSRQLWKGGSEISWQAIEALFQILQQFKYRKSKLSKAHIQLTSFSCMKVSLAAQVFSNSTAEALQKFKDVSPLRDHFNEELVKFIQLMNRWFDCMNSSIESQKKEENSDLKEYTSVNDERLNFLKNEFTVFFEIWKESVMEREGNYSKTQRSRMMISHQSLEGMIISTLSFVEICKFLLCKQVPSISARYFNQDPLEQYFSTMRRSRGADDNLNLKQVLHTRLSLHAQGQVALGAVKGKGNTEILKRYLEADTAPLQKRAKKRKGLD